MTRSLSDRFWSKVNKTSGCWLWVGMHLNGDGRDYGLIKISGKRRLAHRVVWEMKHGPIPDGMFVLHKCDTPRCVRPSHLHLGTHSDNMLEAVERGRRPCGSTHYEAKLSDDDVRWLRRARARGTSLVDLARKFKMTSSAIGRVARRQTYKGVR